MKRILISQNEDNDGTDYVIVNGNFIQDKDLCLKYYKEVRKADDWNQEYKDDILELRSNDRNIRLKSHYLDKDNVNRNIYFTYLIENNDDFETIIKKLEIDSQVIKRTIDNENIQLAINKIKKNKKLKSKIIKVLLVIAAIGITYFIINALKN